MNRQELALKLIKGFELTNLDKKDESLNLIIKNLVDKEIVVKDGKKYKFTENYIEKVRENIYAELN